MSRPELIIEGMLRRALGLHPRRNSSASVERVLQQLEAEFGLDAECVERRLEQDEWLQLQLARAVTVEETYFFRHAQQFDMLVEHLRRRCQNASNKRTFIWSAGCASGEEPYSIAIALQGAFGLSVFERARILATDADGASVTKAKTAVYGSWSFRGFDSSPRAPYFEPAGETTYRVARTLQDAVEFEHCTLQRRLAGLETASVDVIFFRNVAIYMTDEFLDRLYGEMGRVLRPGGLLVLGSADPLLDQGRLRHVSIVRGITRGTDPRSTDPPARRDRAAPEIAVRPERAATGDANGARARRIVPEAREPSPRVESVSSVPRGADGGGSPNERALALADRGQMREALALLDHALSVDTTNASLFALRGYLRLAEGSMEQGIQDLRQALFLGTSNPLVRFHYARGLHAVHRHSACRAQLVEVLRSLDVHADEVLCEDGQTTMASLRRATHELLRRVE